MFSWRKKFTPLASDVPDLLRSTAKYFRNTFSPFVREILVEELKPAPEHFNVVNQLADAYEQRAVAIENALSDCNRHQGKISQDSLKTINDESIATQNALYGVADMSLNLKVRIDQEDFAEIARKKVKTFDMKIEAAQNAIMAIERQIFSQVRTR